MRTPPVPWFHRKRSPSTNAYIIPPPFAFAISRNESPAPVPPLILHSHLGPSVLPIFCVRHPLALTPLSARSGDAGSGSCEGISASPLGLALRVELLQCLAGRAMTPSNVWRSQLPGPSTREGAVSRDEPTTPLLHARLHGDHASLTPCANGEVQDPSTRVLMRGRRPGRWPPQHCAGSR